MVKRKPNNLKFNYDRKHDVLYISVGDPVPSYSDETGLKGLYIRRAIDTEKLTGVTIMDYSKRSKKSIAKHIPFRFDYDLTC